MDLSKRIERLEWELKSLEEKQRFFNGKIESINEELNLLKSQIISDKVQKENTSVPTENQSPAQGIQEIKEEQTQQKKSTVNNANSPVQRIDISKISSSRVQINKKKARSSEDRKLEKFIGNNLILIGGIILFVVGLSFGVKYGIDNGYIGEKARIFLAYLLSLIALGFAFRFRKKYENFSAVLLSGAAASFYITTYESYASYGFITATVAFIALLILTIFTVVAAISYNRSIIANLGLLGAYAIPFLTGSEDGSFLVLMCYMSIVNLGILVVSFVKDWKSLKIVSFCVTWLILILTYADGASSDNPILGFVFSFIFYLEFFGIIVAYKFIKKENMNAVDIILVLLNTMAFYGMGYDYLVSNSLDQYRGLFTVILALINFFPAYLAFQNKERKDNLVYFLGTIVLTLLTIAIPVQLDGNWVTLIWEVEAILLLYLGINKKIQFVQILGFILLMLSFVSFLDDTNQIGYYYSDLKPILNLNFAANALYVLLLFSSLLFLFKREEKIFDLDSSFAKVAGLIIACLAYFSALILAGNEIFMAGTYYKKASIVELVSGKSYYKAIGPSIGISLFIFYSFLNFSIRIIARIRKYKDQLTNVFLGLNIIGLLVFLLLITTKLNQISLMHFFPPEEYFPYTISLVFVRYPVIAIAVYTGITINNDFKKFGANHENQKLTDILLYSALLVVLSTELYLWLKVFKVPEPFKLGISILTTVYTIYLIFRGIYARKVHLRYFGFILLALVLIKLFFYDIAHLKTLSKTIVFVSIGICMLVSSYLYNRFTSQLFDDE